MNHFSYSNFSFSVDSMGFVHGVEAQDEIKNTGLELH